MKKLTGCIFAVAMMVSVGAFAAQPAGQHRGPPQAAIDACASHNKGDTCSVTFGDKSMNGTCNPMRDGKTMVCRPSKAERKAKFEEMKKVSSEACASHKKGDTCNMSFGEKSVNGTCETSPRDASAMFCRPEHAPKR